MLPFTSPDTDIIRHNKISFNLSVPHELEYNLVDGDKSMFVRVFTIL